MRRGPAPRRCRRTATRPVMAPASNTSRALKGPVKGVAGFHMVGPHRILAIRAKFHGPKQAVDPPSSGRPVSRRCHESMSASRSTKRSTSTSFVPSRANSSPSRVTITPSTGHSTTRELSPDELDIHEPGGRHERLIDASDEPPLAGDNQQVEIEGTTEVTRLPAARSPYRSLRSVVNACDGAARTALATSSLFTRRALVSLRNFVRAPHLAIPLMRRSARPHRPDRRPSAGGHPASSR